MNVESLAPAIAVGLVITLLNYWMMRRQIKGIKKSEEYVLFKEVMKQVNVWIHGEEGKEFMGDLKLVMAGLKDLADRIRRVEEEEKSE